jgi:hypothetical protein
MCNMPGEGHGGGQGHGHGHGWGHGSGCCSFHGMRRHGCCMGGGWRRFVSPAEELERLHNYLAELKNEIAGVEARIHELKAK